MQIKQARITKDFKLFRELQMVCKAIHTDQTRIFICGLYYQPEIKRVVATQGTRLHLLDGIDLSNFITIEKSDLDEHNGVLLSVSCKRKEVIICARIDARFPDYLKVIPKEGEDYFKISLPNNYEKDVNISIALYEISEKGFPVNYKYLIDLLGNDYKVFYTPNENSRPLVFKTNNKDRIFRAVIMPLIKN